jgi:hypothetical protein
MKASIYDQIKSVVDIADSKQRVIPAGTLGVVVECYEQPEGYAVDLAISNEKLVGGFEYRNVVLTLEQFAIVQSQAVSS